VSLIIALVVLWTSFPPAFATIFTTLFVPLSVAGLSIVLRGTGFAFHSQIRSLRWQSVAGGTIAQYPDLIPPHMTIAAAAAPTGTQVSEIIVVAIIAVLVIPSFVLLFRLVQRGHLSEPE
jgi:cytochrome d ubiquinol oxidase subunit II